MEREMRIFLRQGGDAIKPYLELSTLKFSGDSIWKYSVCCNGLNGGLRASVHTLPGLKAGLV
jgi:hypothetical protein